MVDQLFGQAGLSVSLISDITSATANGHFLYFLRQELIVQNNNNISPHRNV